MGGGHGPCHRAGGHQCLLWRTRHGIFGYSEPDDAYRAALTGWFSRRYGWQVEAEWNTVTPASSRPWPWPCEP